MDTCLAAFFKPAFVNSSQNAYTIMQFHFTKYKKYCLNRVAFKCNFYYEGFSIVFANMDCMYGIILQVHI